jgi:hypothetical protein
VNSQELLRHWTNFSPPDDWLAVHEELFSRQTRRPGSEMINYLVHNDPISRPVSDPVPYFEMLDFPRPCFAQVPPTGRRDPRFLLYRYAQYASGEVLSNTDNYINTHIHIILESDVETPIVHPAFECHYGMTGPDHSWDLTKRPHFPDIALSNIIPLYPEEYDTYLTHPPLFSMEIRLDMFPILAFDISATGGFGITLRDFIESLTYQFNRRFTVEEWNIELTPDQRYQILIGYERRTGNGIEVAATQDILGYPPSHETMYLVSDILADEHMFLGLAMEDGDPHGWTVYTCSRA